LLYIGFHHQNGLLIVLTFLAVVKHRYLLFLMQLHAFWMSSLVLFYDGIHSSIVTNSLRLLGRLFWMMAAKVIARSRGSSM
jgi:hypothetical protein